MRMGWTRLSINLPISDWPIHVWPIHDSPFSAAESGLPAARRAPESILSRVRPPADEPFPGSLLGLYLSSPIQHPTASRKKKIPFRRPPPSIADYPPAAPVAPARGAPHYACA